MRLASLLVDRRLLGAGALLCAALVATALYMQHVVGLEPCPLCIVQRVLVVVLGVVLLAAAVHDPSPAWRRLYGALVVLVGGLGAGVAARHVWLQNLPPDRVPECGPGLEYMFEAFPLTEALSMLLRGSGECATIQWTFLGLTIPGWTLVVFTALTLYGLALLLVRAPGRHR